MKNDLQSLGDLVFNSDEFCHYCKKVSYKTEQEAKAAASRIRKQGLDHTYPYQCPKGNGWHLTRRKPDKAAKTPKVRKPSKSYRRQNNDGWRKTRRTGSR